MTLGPTSECVSTVTSSNAVTFKMTDWYALRDPDAVIPASGLGSGGLHRKGSNYKPMDEQYVLNQRLNLPFTKPKAEAKGKTKTAAKAVTETSVKAKSATTTKVESTKATNTETKSATKANTKAKAKAKANAKAKAVLEAVPEAVPKVKAKVATPVTNEKTKNNAQPKSNTTPSQKTDGPPAKPKTYTNKVNRERRISDHWGDVPLIDRPFWEIPSSSGSSSDTQTHQNKPHKDVQAPSGLPQESPLRNLKPPENATPPPPLLDNPVIVTIHVDLNAGTKIPIPIRQDDNPLRIAEIICHTQNITSQQSIHALYHRIVSLKAAPTH